MSAASVSTLCTLTVPPNNADMTKAKRVPCEEVSMLHVCGSGTVIKDGPGFATVNANCLLATRGVDTGAPKALAAKIWNRTTTGFVPENDNASLTLVTENLAGPHVRSASITLNAKTS